MKFFLKPRHYTFLDDFFPKTFFIIISRYFVTIVYLRFFEKNLHRIYDQYTTMTPVINMNQYLMKRVV